MTSCIEDIEQRNLIINDALFPIRVCSMSSETLQSLKLESTVWLTFDCGIIFIDEMALNQLYGQTTLANASSADDDKLVFP